MAWQAGENVLKVNMSQALILLGLATISAIPAIYRPRNGAITVWQENQK